MGNYLKRLLAICGCLLLGFPAFAQQEKPSLEGSKASIARMKSQAVLHGLTYHRTEAEVMISIENGELVYLQGDSNYRVDGASFPYVLPETKLLVERLSAQSRVACPDGLVVTSAVRPMNRQPVNASPESVHPTGMAVDLRAPKETSCRVWLKRTLLALEEANVLEASRERRPPHLHAAVYPRQYSEYVAQILALQDEAPVSKASSRRRQH